MFNNISMVYIVTFRGDNKFGNASVCATLSGHSISERCK